MASSKKVSVVIQRLAKADEGVLEWEAKWEGEGTRNRKHYLASPTTRNLTRFPPADRRNKVTISRLRTRQTNVNHYLMRIGKIQDTTCECGATEQTIKHVLTACELTRTTRGKAASQLAQTDIPTLL